MFHNKNADFLVVFFTIVLNAKKYQSRDARISLFSILSVSV